MARIADPLREFAASTELVPGMSLRRCRDELRAIADAIDAEHERRMDQSRRDMRRAACRYMAGVVEDYKRGVKRGRPTDGR